MAILESNIAAPPASYEAYLYTHTNLQNEKKYVGIHMGSVDDEYWHTSSNKEFQNAFSDSDSEFKFEVFMYGSFIEMKNQEHNTLTKVDARNNPQYYNKTNGFPAYQEPDLEKCKAFVEQVKEGVYDVGKEPIGNHVDMLYIQVRFEDDAALQKEIKEKVDDALGNTDKCNSVLVYVGRGTNGEDMRGDGNHTVRGVSQSKHATNIPVARVPYEVHKDYTDAELKAIGNLLNARPDIIKKPIDKKTATKHVVDNYYNSGVPYNSNNNVEWLKAYGFSGALSKGTIKTILKEAKQIIDVKALANANKLFIKYDAQPHHQTLLDTVSAFGQLPIMCSLYTSSGQLKVDRVLETLSAAAAAVGKKIIMVVVHHPSLEQEKIWKTKTQPHWMQVFSNLLGDGFEVRFHEMPTTMSDGSK
jgi:hypothetical protein